MEYKAISKKTMRSKDFKALRAKKPGYRTYIVKTEKNTERCAFPELRVDSSCRKMPFLQLKSL